MSVRLLCDVVFFVKNVIFCETINDSKCHFSSFGVLSSSAQRSKETGLNVLKTYFGNGNKKLYNTAWHSSLCITESFSQYCNPNTNYIVTANLVYYLGCDR
mmetsp:Transcript_22611/g.29894  ORF Transcript_22611/g.29894 Transcript_22611/m.29894 type:complete len:101 (+) Transcript_22611:831-1133(+)